MFGMMSEERCSFVRHIEVLVASMCMCIPSLLSLVPLQDWASAAVVELLFAKAPCPDCCCARFGVRRCGVQVLHRFAYRRFGCRYCIASRIVRALLMPVLRVCCAHASALFVLRSCQRLRFAFRLHPHQGCPPWESRA